MEVIQTVTGLIMEMRLFTATIPQLEILEAAYPVGLRSGRFVRTAEDCVLGRCGAIYEIEMLEADAFICEGKHRWRGRGKNGALNIFTYPNGGGLTLPWCPRWSAFTRPKDNVSASTPGGGMVMSKPRSGMAEDVRLGYVSPQRREKTILCGGYARAPAATKAYGNILSHVRAADSHRR